MKKRLELSGNKVQWWMWSSKVYCLAFTLWRQKMWSGQMIKKIVIIFTVVNVAISRANNPWRLFIFVCFEADWHKSLASEMTFIDLYQESKHLDRKLHNILKRKLHCFIKNQYDPWPIVCPSWPMVIYSCLLKVSRAHSKFLCQWQFKVMNDLRLVHVKSVHDKQCAVYAENNSRYLST